MRNQINESYFQKTNVNLSVVILCYQAGRSARQFVLNTIHEFEKNGITNYELVLVGNYHPNKKDDTPKVVKQLSEEYNFVKYTAQPKEGMMGWDMRSGFDLAVGEYIAIIDGDGQMPIKDVVRVYQKIKNSEFDMVKTFRLKRGDSLKRKFISLVYNIIFRLLFPGIKFRDVNSKPKIFKCSTLKKMALTSNDWFIDAEIMIQARRLKFKTKEIPTNFLKLEDRSSYVKLSAILEFTKNLIKYRVREFSTMKQ